jgi:purine-binding chemotaxis protein CheW
MTDKRQTNQMNFLEPVITSLDQTTGGAVSLPATTIVPDKYVVFWMAEARFAIPLSQVIEVGEAPSITPVPNVPDWVLGVTNLRGDIISVVDCRAFLHLQEQRDVKMSSLCVVRNQQRSLITSLMVDRIEGLWKLSSDLIPLPINDLGEPSVSYLQGVYEPGGQFLNILNLEDLLASLELNE